MFPFSFIRFRAKPPVKAPPPRSFVDAYFDTESRTIKAMDADGELIEFHTTATGGGGPFENLEVTGTLTANHIHGNLAGSVYLHVRAGENLTKGDPVYVSGSHGTGASMIPIVSKADASNLSKMPAIAIMGAAVSANANGHAVIVGTVTDLNTQAYSVNATLYVANGGGLTATKPSDVQPVARVERSNQNNGAIVVKVNGLYSDISPSDIGLAPASSTDDPDTLVLRNEFGTVTGTYVFASTDVIAGGSDYGITLSASGLYFSWNSLQHVITHPTTATSARTYDLPDASGAFVLATVKTTAGDPPAPSATTPVMVVNTNDNNVKIYAEGAWRTLASW